MSTMRAGVIALLFFLWLISGEDRQQTDELQRYLLELKQEANVTESRTFGMNKTHVGVSVNCAAQRAEAVSSPAQTIP